ncbi:MAG: aspartate aminotransferase family protein [Rhodospirillales bacterium]
MTGGLMPTYNRIDIAFERGEGCWLFAEDGRRYLDFAAGIAVNSLGHCHPHVVAALEAQGQKLWHVSNLYRIPQSERLAERLCDASFAEQVFFTNSGVEAIECGIKIVRKYHDETGNPQRWRIVTCGGAFHGRTLTTLAAAGNAKYLAGFSPDVPGFDHVAFGNMNEIRAAISDETAAILVEPIQGEGGIRAAHLDFLRDLRAVCDEFGLLLFFDEVQCGMGRTGKLFAHEWAEIRPDVLASAKGIGSGFPLGACLATAEAAQGMTAGTHGSTYGGNPLATAVGNAVLDVLLSDGFMDQVTARGERLGAGLADLVAKYPTVYAQVRGAGLMRGLQCHPPAGEMLGALREAGLLSVPAAENVLRIIPPLVVSVEEIDEALSILDRVGAATAQRTQAA